MNVEVTKELVLAAEAGANALRSTTESLLDATEAKRTDQVGQTVRRVAEEQLQTADLLDGWALRMRKMHGWSREE